MYVAGGNARVATICFFLHLYLLRVGTGLISDSVGVELFSGWLFSFLNLLLVQTLECFGCVHFICIRVDIDIYLCSFISAGDT